MTKRFLVIGFLATFCSLSTALYSSMMVDMGCQANFEQALTKLLTVEKNVTLVEHQHLTNESTTEYSYLVSHNGFYFYVRLPNKISLPHSIARHAIIITGCDVSIDHNNFGL